MLFLLSFCFDDKLSQLNADNNIETSRAKLVGVMRVGFDTLISNFGTESRNFDTISSRASHVMTEFTTYLSMSICMHLAVMVDFPLMNKTHNVCLYTLDEVGFKFPFDSLWRLGTRGIPVFDFCHCWAVHHK